MKIRGKWGRGKYIEPVGSTTSPFLQPTSKSVVDMTGLEVKCKTCVAPPPDVKGVNGVWRLEVHLLRLMKKGNDFRPGILQQRNTCRTNTYL